MPDAQTRTLQSAFCLTVNGPVLLAGYALRHPAYI